MHVPAAPTGFVLFADDIRQEVGNKASLIGIYDREIILAPGTQLPAAIPKLAIMIIWREPQVASAKQLIFKVTICPLDTPPDSLDEQTLIEATIDAEALIRNLPPPSGPTLGAEVKPVIILSPLVINGPSKIRVMVIRDGERWALGKINIPAPTPVEIPSQEPSATS